MEITEVTIFTVNTGKPPLAFTPMVVRIQTDEAISGIGGSVWLTAWAP